MSLYLSTERRARVAIAVCDRCHSKFSVEDLEKDPNFPGLRVCHDCVDVMDPWRLAPRATENITLNFPRPDTPIPNSDQYYVAIVMLSGVFLPGEIVICLSNQVQVTESSVATVNETMYMNYLLLSGLGFAPGEIVTGAQSGAAAQVISIQSPGVVGSPTPPTNRALAEADIGQADYAVVSETGGNQYIPEADIGQTDYATLNE